MPARPGPLGSSRDGGGGFRQASTPARYGGPAWCGRSRTRRPPPEAPIFRRSGGGAWSSRAVRACPAGTRTGCSLSVTLSSTVSPFVPGGSFTTGDSGGGGGMGPPGTAPGTPPRKPPRHSERGRSRTQERPPAKRARRQDGLSSPWPPSLQPSSEPPPLPRLKHQPRTVPVLAVTYGDPARTRRGNLHAVTLLSAVTALAPYASLNAVTLLIAIAALAPRDAVPVHRAHPHLLRFLRQVISSATRAMKARDSSGPSALARRWSNTSA